MNIVIKPRLDDAFVFGILSYYVQRNVGVGGTSQDVCP